MKLASTWANVGRDTPEKALETFLYGMFTGNRELVASLIMFTDDSAAIRAEFMNNFSSAVRARYPTPELLVAAALFPGNPKKSLDDAFKIVDIRPDERRANQVRIRF